MRVIEKKMLDAINGGYNWREGNTIVLHSEKYQETYVYLHGYLIAALHRKTGNWEYSCCGLHTAATRSRLRALGCNSRIQNFRFVGVDSHVIKTAW